MRLIVTAIAALALGACGTDRDRVPDPTPEMARTLGVPESELVRGHAIYLRHCDRCHERIAPGRIDPEQWRQIMAHVAVLAELTQEQEEEALLYLIAAYGAVDGANRHY